MEKPRTERPCILLVIPHLGGGGAERVFALLAQGLSNQKYELHLAVMTGAMVPGVSIPSSATIHLLAARRVRSSVVPLLALVRRLKPRVILSGMFHLNFLILLLRPLFPHPVQILVRQNGTVSAALSQNRLPRYTRRLYRLLYSTADRVICQSTAMANDLERELGLSARKMVVLPNPIEVDRIRNEVPGFPDLWTGYGPHLLAVGRLSPEKGFDLLLQSLKTLREQFAHADLVIAGCGSEEPALKNQCRSLGLDSSVRFVGHVDEPSKYFPGASAFVLSSRHEGMPNALLEAIAGSLPIIATPASDGLRDMLKDKPGVWLASEVSEKALADVLLAAFTTLESAQRFLHPFIDEFRYDRVLRAYEDLIDTAISATRAEDRT